MGQTTPHSLRVNGLQNSCDPENQQEQSLHPSAPLQRNMLTYGVESIPPSGPPHGHVFCGLLTPRGRDLTFGMESAFCSKYVNNIQALKTSPDFFVCT